MENNHSLKFIFVYVIDLMLAGITAWDILDHTLRTVAAAGVIISTIYLILKHRSDHQVNVEKRKLLEIENKIRQQELFRSINENKEG